MQRVPSEKWDSDRTLTSQAFATPALAICAGRPSPFRIVDVRRLLNELRGSLQQQAGTADALAIISRSPSKLEPLFRAMLENAVRTNFGTRNCAKTVRSIISQRVRISVTPPPWNVELIWNNMQRAERFSCSADQIRADSTPVDVSDDTGKQPLASPLISPITLALSDHRLGLLASIRAE